MRSKSIIRVIVFLFIFVSLVNVEIAEAAEHKLEGLYIHTFIHEDGSATITEKRNATLSEGTENYDIIENLGESTIIDFIVEENGTTYEYVENWDVDASQDEKSFKNGIIETANGYELAWGIGEYGQHEYILTYTVTDFIKQLEDSQVLFWRYVNDQSNIPPENITIEIETEKHLAEEEEKIWGFGFEGDIQFEDGKIVARNDEPLRNSDYATVLVKFTDGLFGTGDVIDRTFEDVKNEAFQGSDYSPNDNFTKVFLIIPGIIILSLMVVISLFIILVTKAIKLGGTKRKYKGEYYRDIPYDGSFVDVYHLLLDMNAATFENLLSAFILKWINEGRIEVVEEDVGLIFKSKAPVIYIINSEMDRYDLEGQLFEMFLNSKDEDGKIDKAKFARWIESNRSTMRTWEKEVKETSADVLERLDFVEAEERRTFFIPRIVYTPTEKGRAFEANVYKYVNYLRDFSLLNEHEPVNVKIWDDIMIWAALLGLTDVVYDQLQTLYPQYKNESSYSTVSVAASRAYSKSISQARSYASSGGGGSTSGGGGGGSFGGGSGGGTR